MRHLVVADLHYSLRQWDWLLREAGHFDGVIVAGDLLDLASAVDLEAQSVVILKYLARLAAAAPRVLVTSGNHDLDGVDEDQERAALWLAEARTAGALIDGDGCDLDGWRLTLCPWWDGERGRSRVAAQLAGEAARRNGPWGWIHHAPPKGCRTSWTGKADAGDPVLTGWIREYQPDFVLCGHIHQAPFQAGGAWTDTIGRTRVFNAGHYLAAEPPFLVLDLAARTVEWISAAGREQIALGATSG